MNQMKWLQQKKCFMIYGINVYKLFKEFNNSKVEV